jgi:hypothetical protein
MSGSGQLRRGLNSHRQLFTKTCRVINGFVGTSASWIILPGPDLQSGYRTMMEALREHVDLTLESERAAKTRIVLSRERASDERLNPRRSPPRG